jgi:ketosteroid isomerase-like protein
MVARDFAARLADRDFGALASFASPPAVIFVHLPTKAAEPGAAFTRCDVWEGF